MFGVELDGFDKLDAELQEAQRAMEAVNGELCTLSIDPNNPVPRQSFVRMKNRATHRREPQGRTT
jgi:hypothetical protein